MFSISGSTFSIRQEREKYSQTIQIPVSNSTVDDSVWTTYIKFLNSNISYFITGLNQFLLHYLFKSIETTCFHQQL